VYLGARRLTGINTILNLVTYIFTYFLLEIPFDIYFFIFLIFAFVFYYIFNIYSLERGKISGVDYFYSLMLNVIFSIFAVSMLDIKEALLYFLILFFIQNIYKFLFYKFVVRDRNIIIIGKNEKADKLKKLLNEKQMYKVVAEIGCE
jgi:FlaA1/EpsC-like NDP-sugar epimerase